METESKEVIINDVKVSSSQEIFSVVDEFSEVVANSKALNGVDSNFKRRFTTKARSLSSGLDGASSSANERDGLNSYEAFEVVAPPFNLNTLTELFSASAPHYAACNAKVSSIVGLGYKLVETNKTKRAFEDQEDEEKVKKARSRVNRLRDNLGEWLDDICGDYTFVEVLVMAWRDYEATGNGYIEIGRKTGDGKIGYVGHIPSNTMRVRSKRDGFVQLVDHNAVFFKKFGEKSNYNPINGGEVPNEIIHLKKYNPSSTYYGVSDIVAAQSAVAGNEFAARFNLDYFENKAVPRYVVTLKGAKLSTQAESKLLNFFEASLKGQNHRTLYLPLPPDTDGNKVEFNMKAVESGVQDSSFNNYRKANHQDILMVHRVPVTKISSADGVNLAIARDADKTFKEQVCSPEQRILEKKINRIVRDYTDVLEITMNEMSLTDEDTASKIDDRLVKAGIKLPNEARLDRGWPGIDGGNTRVDLNNKTSQSRDDRRTEREASATDSNGEGRNTKGDGRAPGTE